MRLLTGFQSALLVCWFEVKTGIYIAEYLYILILGAYILFRIGWFNAISKFPINTKFMRM